jgi:riboflavin kinase/FMN adenylyltransferase
MRVTSSTADVFSPSAIALGNFDGVHLGHQKVLEPILAFTDEPAGERPYLTAVTFTPHPREFFSGKSWQLLTPLPEKVEQLEKLGIEQLVLLPFDRELAQLTPQQFVEEILVKQLQARRVSVGEDFCFGHRRAGTAADLQQLAAKFDVGVTVCTLKNCSDGGEAVRISSSLIRQALAGGDIPQANRMLGRAYSLRGKVVRGQQLGRTLGFATANLALPPEKFLPANGVYGVSVFLEAGGKIPGVMNIGCRPTVAGKEPTVEVHLLDWSGDLYGQQLAVSLEEFLRPEQPFPSLDALKAQIAADCEFCRKRL